jgi:hypothetical protein
MRQEVCVTSTGRKNMYKICNGKPIEPREEMGTDGRSSNNGFKGTSGAWSITLKEKIILTRILQK